MNRISSRSLLLLFILPMAVMSCKKDPAAQPITDLIIGIWNYEYTVEWEYINQTKVESTKRIYPPLYDDEWRTLEFTESKLAIFRDGQGLVTTGNYHIADDGKSIIFTNNDESDEIAIHATENSLVLKLGVVVLDEQPNIVYWMEDHYTRIE